MMKSEHSANWVSFLASTTKAEPMVSLRPATIPTRSFDGLESAKISSRRNRNKQACIACRRRKIRCTGDMVRCTHCTEKNQDCRFEAVTEEEKLKAQSYKSRLMRRRRQACVFWDVLPAEAVQSQQQQSPSTSPSAMMASMDIVSASAPTSPVNHQRSAAYHVSPFVPSDVSSEDLNFQQYLYQRHPQTYQSLASPFDSPDSVPRMPHTSYNESTVSPFFRNTTSVLSSSMTPSRSSPLQQQQHQQQHNGMFYPCVNDLMTSPFNAAPPALSSSSFSSPALSVSSPSSTLVTPKNEFSVDYSAFMVQQQASQYRLSAGLGLHEACQSTGAMPSGSFAPSSMPLPPSVMAPVPTDSKAMNDADFFALQIGEYASTTYSAAPVSALDAAGMIRPYALDAPPFL